LKEQELVSIINCLERKELPEDQKQGLRILTIAKKGYFVLDGVLYFESSDVPGWRRLVVPETPGSSRILQSVICRTLFSKEDLTKIEIVFLLARYEFFCL